MSKKNKNPKHWNLCTIKEVAEFTRFTEQNIRDRYKNVEGKENLYNAFQVMTYINEKRISEEEFILLTEMYLSMTFNNKLLKHMIFNHLDE